MIYTFKGVLNAEDIKHFRARLADATFVDGRESAHGLARAVKHNQQLDKKKHKDIIDALASRLRSTQLLLRISLADKIYPPTVNRYGVGMSYDDHVDAATIGNVRTDLSLTLFLNEPEDYDGGELMIETEIGESSVKLKAGDLVLYPSGRLHRVNPVTRGERLALVTWIQSRVQDPVKRAMLHDLRRSIDDIKKLDESPETRALAVRLLKTQVNLEQMWST